MSKILIKLSGQQNQLYAIEQARTIIGRGEEADLILPNLSVSREHAVIETTEHGTFISDLESQNGITVDGTAIPSNERHQLSSKEEIQIGNFTLIFLGETQEDRFYRGRAITYLPKYDPKKQKGTADSTFKLTPEQAAAMLVEKSRMNHGCVTDSENRHYFPETNPLTFGGRTASIRVNGWFIRGVVATIRWDQKRHVLEKDGGFFVSVRVNGNGISRQVLNEGDQIQIGSSLFTYQMVEDF